MTTPSAALAGPPEWSVARQWNEELLGAIRHDYARPTVHARNLYHVSAAMWDAWAAYDKANQTLIHHEKQLSINPAAAREEAISYAAYRLMRWRFANSPGGAQTLAALDALMNQLGYDKNITTLAGNSPAAVGNRVAQAYIDYGLTDGSNEANDFDNLFYEPINEPLLPKFPGNPDITDPNRWQPLALDTTVDQGGNVIVNGFPGFLSPEWGTVKAFALSQKDLTIYQRDGHDYWVFHDPGPPPQLGGEGDALFKKGFEQVVLWSGLLDPSDGVMIDISPASNGNSTLGTNDGTGYDTNPATGQPYTPEVVPAGDYYRVLAEFWADGPQSETPPGHWFTIANYVSDHPLFTKRLAGKGPVLSDLEWDVKMYLVLGGTMHDVAVTSWGIKGWYDYTRPISAIRYMCDQGQSSDPQAPSYHPEGISLYPGSIELITAQTAAPGGRHFPLGGNLNQHLGKIAVHSWKGPNFISNPDTDTAGVDWIRCEDWWPYQRPSFVTPPFAGYVSGHSTYSRAASELMSRMTGDEFFPGGLGTFAAPKNEFLVFEEGPSVDILLQWAKYTDASDETSLSRIYGGIHPPADDMPGRIMGRQIAIDSYALALKLFGHSEDDTIAKFEVSKDFANSINPSEVDVALNCNTGLPLQQTQTISENHGVNFVVSGFKYGELDCTVTEDLDSLPGFTPGYLAEGPGETDSNGACHFLDVEGNTQNSCRITNTGKPVQIAIEKLWVIDGNGGDLVDQNYKLTLYCDSDIEGGDSTCASGNSNYSSCKVFQGKGPGLFTAEVVPLWPATLCRVEETAYYDAVQVDNGCLDLVIVAGDPTVSCRITNTVFFEGIPTLGQFSMILLALMMLGVGLIALPGRSPGA